MAASQLLTNAFRFFKFHYFDSFLPAPFLIGLCIFFFCSPLYVYLAPCITNEKFNTVRPNFHIWPNAKGAAILLASVVLQWLLLTIHYWFSAKGLFALLNCSVLAGLAVPALGAFSYWIANKLLPTKSLKPTEGSTKVSLIKKIKRGLRQLLTQIVPYNSLYCGFFLTVVVFCFAPNGLGQTFGAWLMATLRDANMTDRYDGAVFNLAASIGLSLGILNIASPIMVRISAGYQLLLQKIFHNPSGDDILSIIDRCIRTRSANIPVKAKHPHIRSAFETLALLLTCYGVLFAMIGLVPTSESAAKAHPFFWPLFELGHTIEGWVAGSMIEANLSAWQIKSVRLFLASFIAGCYATPLAVTICAFLPSRKPESIYVSEQGLLMPSSFGRKLLFWSELKSVSLKNEGKPKQEIVLKFKTKTVSIPCNELEPEKQAELLAFADELSDGCKMHESVCKLRTILAQENGTSSLAETKNFESTIFMPHLPGEQVTGVDNEYRIIRKMLSKPLSAVYLARQKDGRLVVLKQFVAPAADEKTQKQRESFLQEYRLLKALSHSQLANVVDSFEIAKSTYIVIEHIDGIDLRQLVKRSGKRQEKLVAKWAIQICDQLKYMHEREIPILHRDLTPDNLMLDDDGIVRIIDFGAAHQFMEGVTGTLIGKQSYIAPEQLRGRASKASDIYSLGATMAFLLTGEDPKALQKTNLQDLHEGISNEMSNLIASCTEFEESKRPGLLDEIIATLKKISKGQTNQTQSVKATEGEQMKIFLSQLSTAINSDRSHDTAAAETTQIIEAETTLAKACADSIKLKNDDAVIVNVNKAEEVES